MGAAPMERGVFNRIASSPTNALTYRIRATNYRYELRPVEMPLEPACSHQIGRAFFQKYRRFGGVESGPVLVRLQCG